jgi:hypothetical protein
MRRRHHVAEARHEVLRCRHHSSRPVAPGLTKRILDASIVSLREPLERGPKAPQVVPPPAPSVDVPPLAVDEEEFEEQAARAVRARRIGRIARIEILRSRAWEPRKRS